MIDNRWIGKAACKGMTHLFFPDAEQHDHLEIQGMVKRAKTICASCPVQPECLEYAVTRNERFGIWGGTGERTRRRMRAERRLNQSTPNLKP